MKTLLLIDANALIHRSFHALPPLTGPGGEPTQAIYGLGSIFLKLWREDKPDYAAALFDRPEPTFRKEKYAEYKAQRPAAPSELISQIIEAHHFFSEFGIKTFEKPGFEGDDCIATFAEKFKHIPDLQVVILTGDMDTMQLVEGEKVVVRTFKKGISDTMIYDEGAVIARYGLRPNQMTDYKALVGDPSDNIKGVPGVGPKTAAALLQEFGTLENVYKNLGKVKIGEKLKTYKKEAFLSKELVVLERNVPLEIKDIEELAVHDNQRTLAAYFKKFGFESLLKRMENGVAPKGKPQAPAFSAPANSLFSDTAQKSFVSEGDIVFITDTERIDTSDTYSSKKLKAGFAIKTLVKKLLREGKELASPYFDLGVAFWLLNPDFKSYDPQAVARGFLKREWRGDKEDFQDAHKFASEKLAAAELMNIFTDIEMPVLNILAEMETHGVLLDQKKLAALHKNIETRIGELTEQIHAAAGKQFNINSPKQLREILSEHLAKTGGAKLTRKTAGGQISTDAESLMAIQKDVPLARLVLEYRDSFKIQSTYVAPFRELHGEDGRLHTDFIQTGTATGRLSSREPNLQNVPQGSMWAKDLRAAFVAPEGHSLVSADYSQIELRILASVSKDPKMIETFKRGLDIHQATASKILGVSFDKITPDMRRLAKTLNFGLIYGMGVTSFAKTSGLPKQEAQRFVDSYFAQFSRVRAWQEETKARARTLGYVQTMTGRRRYLPAILSNSPRFRAEAERAATNQPIQGLASDIIKLAMIGVKRAFQEKGWWRKEAKMILSVHDELLFEVADSMIKEAIPIIRDAMERVYDLGIPLTTEIALGKDWGNLQKIKK